MSNPNYEPFFEQYKENLKQLNEIALSTNEPIEGNVFYNHNSMELNMIEQGFRNKRKNLTLAAMTFSDALEIGFNAGHSALLMLTANPHLKLTYIDICSHRYTLPCFQYLRSVFEGRIELINSNSLHAFPSLAFNYGNFDLFIIDGGHGIDVAETDLFNVIKFGRRGSIILFDDSDFPPLRTMLSMYMLSGKIINISDPIWLLQNTNQMFFMNNKNEN